MKRKRYPWWGYVKNIMYSYNDQDREITEAEREAVKQAIIETEQTNSARERFGIINRVFFEKTHKVYGAAREVHCAERTAYRYQNEFIMCVAKHRGLL